MNRRPFQRVIEHWSVERFDKRVAYFVSDLVLRAVIFFGLVIWASLALAWDNHEFSKDEIRYIREAGDSIRRIYPPDQYIYVGVGRSPTALMAYLQLKDPSSVLQLPASGLASAPPVESLSQGAKALIERHFSRFLPREDQLGSRQIVLIDFVGTGRSLKIIQEYVNYIWLPHHPAKVLALAYHRAPDDQYEELPWMYADQVLFFRGLQQAWRFAKEDYDGYSAFTPAPMPFRNETELESVHENRNYRILVAALERDLKRYAPFDCGELLRRGYRALIGAKNPK
jgi:hypothetical protein